jgi:hypothetical protein
VIIIALALVLIFAVLASASLKLTQRPAYALSLYMFAFADIVVAGLSASLFSLLSSQVFFIAVHILLAAGALAWWFKSGRPALLGPWKNNCDLFYPGWWKQSWKSGAVVWALSILVGIVYILNAYIINIVPPNNNDSMTNHMARVGFWLQHGNLLV